MTLTLELAPEEEAILQQQAQAVGLTPQSYAKEALFSDPAHVARRLKKARALALLQTWVDEANGASEPEKDAAHREWSAAMRSLDEDRGESRKLFSGLAS